MRLSTWAAIAVAALCTGVNAASMPLSDVPQCGLACAISIVGASECKSIANTTCVCSSQQVTTDLGECVLANCTIPESLAMQKFSDILCGVEPVDNSWSIKVITPVFISLALLCFLTRVFARYQTGLRATWRTDDWLLLPAIGGLVPLFVTCEMLASKGLGEDMWWLTPDEISYILYWFYWAEICYIWCVTWTKVSVLAFFLQIFPNKRFRVADFVLIFANFGSLLSLGLSVALQCNPVAGAWLAWDGIYEAKCVDVNALVWAGAGITITLDMTTLVLPLPLLWKLNMSLKKKIQVMLMCSVGIFVTVVSIIRLQSIVAFTESSNATQNFLPVGNWSIIEICVGVICACLPAMRAVLAKFAPTVFGSTAARSGEGYISGPEGRRTGASAGYGAGLSGNGDGFDPAGKITKSSTTSTPDSEPERGSQIRVKTEFTVRSRRRDEASFIELDTLSDQSDREQGADGGHNDRQHTTVATVDERSIGGDETSSRTSRPTSHKLVDDMSDIEADALIRSGAPPGQDRAGYVGRADPRYRSTPPAV